jgi:hypothetical protein
MSEKPKERISGGKSEGMTCEEIAAKHGVDLKEITEQVTKGARIEHEHTTDNDIAKEIARDHLVEHPFYYDFLEDMEKEMEKDYDNEEYGPAKEEEEESDAKDPEGPEAAEIARRTRLKQIFG